MKPSADGTRTLLMGDLEMLALQRERGPLLTIKIPVSGQLADR
jgi:hypothetical protein